MVDIYTAAICANPNYIAPELPGELSKGLKRLAAGLVLLACIFGNLP